MNIETIDELKFNYDNKHYHVSCKCPKCGKEFEVKSKARMERMLERKSLTCRECVFDEKIKSRTDEDRAKITEKHKQTNIERHGVENTWQLEKVKEMSRNRDWTERNKHSKQTNLRKYGTTYAGWDENACKKREETLIKHYGSVKNAYKERQKKIEQTNLKKRGYKTNLAEPGFHDKAMQTILEKYGRPIYSRTYIYDETCFDSSWELAYYVWLKDSGLDFEFQPKCDFHYIGDDGKDHQYFPDFKVNGEFQEIKGNQFFNEKDEPYCCITKKFWWEKYNFIKENKIKLIREPELKFVFNYVKDKYGKNFLKEHKIQLKKP